MLGTQYYENDLDLHTSIKIPATIILNKDMEQTTEEKLNVIYANQYTIDNTNEIGNKEIQVKLENYKEETDNLSTVYNVAQQIVAENANGLLLEVTPTKATTELKNNDIVYEGEYIKYNIKVTNASEEDMQNVKIEANIPEGVTYGELYAESNEFLGEYKYNFNTELKQKDIEIGNIKAGETVTKFYEVKVDDLEQESKQISTNINVYIGEALAKTYEISNTINKAEVKAFMGTLIDYGRWEYYLNLYSDEKGEIDAKVHLPQGFKVEEIIYSSKQIEGDISTNQDHTTQGKLVYSDYEILPPNMSEQKRDLDVQISEDNVLTAKLQKNGYYAFRGNINASEMKKPSNQANTEIIAYTEIIGQHTYLSNENRYNYNYENVDISMSSQNEGENVKNGEEINYDINIENIGGSNVKIGDDPAYININVSDFLPNEVIPKEIIYNNWELTGEEDAPTELIKKEEIVKDISTIYTDDNNNRLANIDLSLIIPKGEKVKITVKTIADYLYKDTKIENSAVVSGEKIDTKTTNVISHTILSAQEQFETPNDPETPGEPEDPWNPEESENPNTPENPSDPNNPSNPNNPDNPTEPKEDKNNISGVAWLDNNEDGERAANEKLLSGITVMLIDMNNATTEKAMTKTDNNGKYEFKNIEKGKYIVLFQYDTDKYRVSQYRKMNINDSVNSDAIGKTVTLNGKETNVGVTDIIELNKSISNIDIGLIENKLCDFKVDNYISKVTVKTTQGTTVYDFSNQSLPKFEIKGNEIEGANVVIEYKIIVTNVGEVAGTVGKVIDYLPDGLNMISNSNNNWAKGLNNQIINTSISNKRINVGEKVELTLNATRKMTANSTGTLKNRVEIQNINSVIKTTDENNKNDSATIDLIISIKTGVILYTSIIISVLAILTVIAIVLYKKRKN